MAWDSGVPVAGRKARLVSGDLRTNNAGLEAALTNWMDFTTGSTQTGRPKQGSARIYCQTTTPTVRLDGTHFTTAADAGTLWIHTDDTVGNTVYFLSTADGNGANVWVALSTAIITTLLAAARVFGSTLGVTGDFAALANATVAGSLDVASFGTSKGGFIDEDSFATDSATKVPSQQSVKAYVDASAVAIGASSVVTPESAPIHATTDGFLVGTLVVTELSNDDDQYITIKSDSAATPATVVGYMQVHKYGPPVAGFASCCVPIKSGDYYSATQTVVNAGGLSTRVYRFIPLS